MTSTVQPDVDAVIVGAGFSGLYALHRLRKLGLTVRSFERGSGVGGTWYWNRYPGLECDTESFSYSFTFDSDLYKEWEWSHRYASREAIASYADFVADRLDLRPHITFGVSVVGARFDDLAQLWRIRTDDGLETVARYLIPAAGPLSTVNRPEFPGLDSFSGEIYHTGNWPHTPVELAGRRVAVVGTGSSGVQVLTEIAPYVSELVVLQRTPQYVVQKVQRPLSEGESANAKAHLEELISESQNSIFGAPGALTDRSVFDDEPEERERRLEEAWQKGALAFPLGTYNDFIFSEEANEIAADFIRRKILSTVHDPEVARKLLPKFHFATKRPVHADGYFEIYNRENVTLVSTTEEPVVEITRTGVVTSERSFDVDVIIFATGFDAYTAPLFNLNVQGHGGLGLREAWHDGAEISTLHGVTVAGFPNMFLVQGPQSLSLMANFLFGIEVNVDYIVGLISRMEAQQRRVCETDPQAAADWAQHCQELVMGTLIPRTESWWLGANVPGKPRPKYFPNYIGGVQQYRAALSESELLDYPGLRMEFAAVHAE